METKNNPIFKPDPKLKLMDQVRQLLRYHRRPVATVSSNLSCSMVLKVIIKNSATIERIDKLRGAWMVQSIFYNSNFSYVKEKISFRKLFLDENLYLKLF